MDIQLLWLVLVLAVLVVVCSGGVVKEHYYDVTPYDYNWRVDTCLDGKCVIKRSYECYQYCDNIADYIASEKCRVDCLDTGDEMFDHLKWQNYNWPLEESNVYFQKYSILNGDADYE